MKRLTILCDMDGILVDLTPYWLDCIARDTGVRVFPDEINQWSIHKCGALTQLRPDQVYGYLHQPGFFRNAPALPGAVEGLKALHDLGHDVFICSSPSSPESAKEKLEWLADKAPWLKPEKVFLANKKTMVKGDVLIDDHPDTLTEYPKHWPGAFVLGIEYPYNRQLRGTRVLCSDYADTVKAWNEILDHIASFAAWPKEEF